MSRPGWLHKIWYESHDKRICRYCPRRLPVPQILKRTGAGDSAESEDETAR